MPEIKETKVGNPDYPKLLKDIKNPPKALFFVGELNRPDEICFAVVGTRRCSTYGRQVALDIVSKLVDAGLTIVSGLAPGIDTICHQICVEKKKRTIAVLGTGLDEKSIYPKENISLSKKILENGGCLISELPAGTSGSKFTFPNRNRIISGLSVGTLVIEAKEKSGSLITARYTISQKRKLFSVPGSIYSLNSAGTNKIIKEGAFLVDKAQDILQQLHLSALPAGALTEADDLDNDEKLIIESLRDGSLHIDKIIEKTKLKAFIISGAIATLEINGKIRNLGGNVYSINR